MTFKSNIVLESQRALAKSRFDSTPPETVPTLIATGTLTICVELEAVAGMMLAILEQSVAKEDQSEEQIKATKDTAARAAAICAYKLTFLLAKVNEFLKHGQLGMSEKLATDIKTLIEAGSLGMKTKDFTEFFGEGFLKDAY